MPPPLEYHHHDGARQGPPISLSPQSACSSSSSLETGTDTPPSEGDEDGELRDREEKGNEEVTDRLGASTSSFLSTLRSSVEQPSYESADDLNGEKFSAFCTTTLFSTNKGKPKKRYANGDRNVHVETHFQGEQLSWRLQVPKERLETYLFPSLEQEAAVAELAQQGEEEDKDKDIAAVNGENVGPMKTHCRHASAAAKALPVATDGSGSKTPSPQWKLDMSRWELEDLLDEKRGKRRKHERVVISHHDHHHHHHHHHHQDEQQQQNYRHPEGHHAASQLRDEHLRQVSRDGDRMIRARLVEQAQAMLVDDSMVLKGAISRDAHRALKDQNARRRSFEAAYIYYNLVRDARARESVRRVDTVEHYRELLHKNVSQRWPWMTPRSHRPNELALLYYQKRQAFETLKARLKPKPRPEDLLRKVVGMPKFKSLVHAAVKKDNLEADLLHQQSKHRLRFYERYRRTVEALQMGHDIRNTKPKFLEVAKQDDTGEPLTMRRRSHQQPTIRLDATTSLLNADATNTTTMMLSSSMAGTSAAMMMPSVDGSPMSRNLREDRNVTMGNTTALLGNTMGRRTSGHATFRQFLAMETAISKATDQFLYHCEVQGVVPEPLLLRQFLGNYKAVVDLSHFSMGDAFGIALARSIPFIEGIRSLDLSDNRLTACTLIELLQGLGSRQHLVHLNLSHNDLSGHATVAAMSAFLATNTTIEDLNISKGCIGPEDMTRVVRALEGHRSLHHVNLSDNILGFESCRTLADVLAGPKCGLSVLDISWTQVDAKGGCLLGLALAHNTSLTIFDMSNNSLDNEGGQAVGSALKHNETLQRLVMKHSGIGGQACLTIAHALRLNNSLRMIQLDGNLLTEEGGRALFRAIISGLSCEVTMKGCSYMYTHDLLFSYSAPRLYSPYTLDMQRPVDQAILAELCNIAARNPGCELLNMLHTDTMPLPSKKATLNGRKIAVLYRPPIQPGERFGSIIDTSTGRPLEPPTKGVLCFSMRHRRRLPREDRDNLTPMELETLLQYLLHSSLDRREFEDCLALVSDDIYLTTTQVQYIINRVHKSGLYETHMDEVVSVLSRVFSRIVDSKNLYDFVVRQLPSTPTRNVLANRITLQTYRCNSVNMTGHWHVDLSQKGHRDVLMLLAAINDEESFHSRTEESGRGDTSQRGNWCNFRNETMNNQPFALTNDNIDELPRIGVLEFDYVNTTRPSSDAEPITDARFIQMMSHLGAVVERRVWKLHGVFSICELALAVCREYFSVAQVLALVDCLPEGHTQPLVVCTMFSRIVDLHNFDRILRKLAPDLAREVIHRLGWLNVLNPYKPSGWRYELDLRYYDHRVMAQVVLNLGSSDTNGDAIMEEADTEMAVMSLYATLGRLHEIPMNATAVFSYAETLERGVTPNWTARHSALRMVLLGTKPIHVGVADVAHKFEELQKHGILRIGNIEDQYQAYMEGVMNDKRARRTSSTKGGRRRSSVVTGVAAVNNQLTRRLSSAAAAPSALGNVPKT